jgi:hypothetical protein
VAVTKLELPTVPPKASWAVTGIFPIGHTSMLYAPAGVGKTRIVSYLAAQMTRPYPNGLFLGHEVRGGRVVILDADDPTGYGYAVWLNRFLRAHVDTRRELIDLRAITGGLTPEDVAKLQAELKDAPPRLIVIDTFASAFVGLDILRAHHVQLALVGLAQLAKELNCAVLILDHVGKLQPGQTVASKGPYGAAKTFSPRAVFALSRVPPKEVEGRDILKLECTKMSYAPELPPKGVEISLEDNDTVARARLADLPGKTMLENAVSTVREELRRANGEPVTRKALIQAAVEKVNITERWAAKALDDLITELGDRLEVLTLPAKGSPKAYRYVLSSSNANSSVPDGATFDEVGSSSNGESSANSPYEQLRLKLERGEWRIPHADELKDTFRRADDGDASAQADIAAYLDNPEVITSLRQAWSGVN